MPFPIELTTGEVVEDYDDQTITVRTGGGRKRILRRGAPSRFLSAVDQQERAAMTQGQSVPGFTTPQTDTPVFTPGGFTTEPARVRPQPGAQVFSRQGEVLANQAPAPPPVEPQAPRAPLPFIAETPEDFQRRQGNVRAPVQALDRASGDQPRGTPADAGQFQFRQAQPAANLGPTFATKTNRQTTRERLDLSKDQQRQLDEARIGQDQATRRLQDRIAGQAVDIDIRGEERRELLDEGAQIREKFADERARTDAVNRERELNMIRDEEELLREIQNAEIDTGRVWRNKSTGQKIAGGIAAAIGGFLSQGKSRSVIDQLNLEIARDIDAQKAALANKKVALAKSSLLFAKAKARGLSDLEAVDAAQNSALASVESRMRDLAARAGDAERRDNLLRLADEAAIKREQNREDSLLRTAGKVRTTSSRQRVPVSGGAGGPVLSGGQKLPGLTPTGQRTVPLSSAEIKEAGKMNRAIGGLMRSMKTMIELRRKHGREFFGEAKARFEAARKNAVSVMGEIHDKGVLQEGERADLESMFANISDIGLSQIFTGQDPVMSRLEGMNREMAGFIQAGMNRQYGLSVDALRAPSTVREGRNR